MNVSILLPVITLVGKLIPLGSEIVEAVSAAMADGDLSADDAESIGREIGEAAGGIVVKVKGQDIVHGPAMELIGGGLARVARQVVLALRA